MVQLSGRSPAQLVDALDSIDSITQKIANKLHYLYFGKINILSLSYMNEAMSSSHFHEFYMLAYMDTCTYK